MNRSFFFGRGKKRRRGAVRQKDLHAGPRSNWLKEIYAGRITIQNPGDSGKWICHACR
jgi:hypothetical protein